VEPAGTGGVRPRGRLLTAPALHQAASRLRSWTRTGPGKPLLPVVRGAFCGFLLLCLGTTVPQWMLDPVVPVSRSWPVLPALAGLSALALRLHRGTRPHLVTDVLAALGVGVVVWGVGALPAGGVLFVGVTFRALYGGFAGSVTATLLTLGATTAGVLAAGGSLQQVRLGQYGPGLVMSTLALRLVLTSVQRYETGAAARFEAVVRSSRDVILITDADTAARYVSPALQGVFGVPDLPGGRLLTWIADADRDAATAHVAHLAARPGSAVTFTCRVPTLDAEEAQAEISGQNLLEDPHVQGLLFAVRDVTQRSRLTDRLRHLAFHDPLTGLANRALLAERLAAADGRVALLLIDLDAFKAVNDTLGHVAGDELLVEVAVRVQRRLEPADTLARLGGDEFAVVLTGGRAEPHVAEQVADAVLTALEVPVTVAQQRRRVTASIGIAVAGADADPGRLMREADVALYRAKTAGRARHVQYRHELHRHAVEQMQLQLDLAEALQRGELELHYQPIHALGTGHWAGVEALLRWRRGGGEALPPADFVPIAESSGLIVPIGRWVLDQACRSGARWQRRTGRPLQMNVNVSMVQLAVGSLVGDVRDALAASGLAPTSLTVEITESTLATDGESAGAQLEALRRLGVRIALDDFGTGFNSLGSLHRYPVDELKIDKSFVDRLGRPTADSLPILVGIMAMSRGLNLRTVAEGIETDEQHARLTALGCDFAQGFRLSRPLDEATTEARLLAGCAARPQPPSPGRMARPRSRQDDAAPTPDP